MTYTQSLIASGCYSMFLLNKGHRLIHSDVKGNSLFPLVKYVLYPNSPSIKNKIFLGEDYVELFRNSEGLSEFALLPAV